MMYSGDKLSDIPDKQYLTIETEHAAEIIRGLDLSGIAYFAKAEENVIYLTFSADCKVVVDEIVAKAESGDYEELMLQLSENGSDGYAPLYAEIAEILHCAVGSVTSRPPEITDILAKTYINYWHSDRQTIQRALERIIDLNAETENELAVMERTDIHRKEMPDKEHLQQTQAVSDGEADRRWIAEGIIVEENRSVYNGNITYAIRITNLPENYRFYYGKSRVMYGICGFGLEEFENGTELDCIAYLEDVNKSSPKYSY